MPIFEFAVVLFLVALNGFFAMSELAIVSSRPALLRQLAGAGNPGAARALRLLEDPTGFLSTVQIGITTVGILAGAFGGATLSRHLAEMLAEITPLADHADDIAFVFVVVAITYLSLIVGELVPKRIAMAHAERIACAVAPLMARLARVGAPAVWLLRHSTEAALRLMRIPRKAERDITEEEIRTLIAEGTVAGIFKEAERAMIEGVFRFSDRSVRSIMVPRVDVEFIDVDASTADIRAALAASDHSCFPACRGDDEAIVGVLHVKDLVDAFGNDARLVELVREPVYVNDGMSTLKLLEQFRRSPVRMALVYDEFGSFEGIVTPQDILSAIAGSFYEGDADDEPGAVRRTDGSWLLDGKLALHHAEQTLGINGMHTGHSYTTVAGFVLQHIGHLPKAGEEFLWHGWRIEVVDMDGRRIDKVLAQRDEAQQVADGGR